MADMSFITCVNKLREKLEQVLLEKFPNKKGQVVIKKAAKNINDNVEFIYLRFEDKYSSEDTTTQESIRLNHFLKRIDEDSDKPFVFTISPGTLGSFLNTNNLPHIETLHIFALYLNYVGWYHFEYEIEKELEKKEHNQGNLKKQSTSIESLKNNNCNESYEVEQESEMKIIREKKLVSKLKIPIYILLLTIIACLIYLAYYSINKNTKFSDQVIGILVLPFEGDSDKSIVNDILFTIGELVEDTSKIEIRLCDTKFSFFNNNAQSHKKACEIGNHFNASLVIWGGIRKGGGNDSIKYHSRITLTDKSVNKLIGKKYIIQSQILSDLELPDNLVNHPIILAYLILSYEKYKNKDYGEAIKIIEPKVKDSTFHRSYYGPIFNFLGQCYDELFELKHDTGFIQKADYYYSEAIRLNPKKSLYLCNRGKFFLFANQYKKALRDFNLAMNMDSLDSDVLYSKALYYYKTEEHDSALYLINKVLLHDVGNSQMYNLQGAIYASKGNFYDSYICFYKAVKNSPRTETYWSNMGRSCIEIGNFESAEEDFKRYLKFNPNSIQVYAGLCGLYIEKNDKENARKYLNELIEMDSLSADVMKVWGDYYFWLEDYSNSILYHKKAIELNPDYVTYKFLCMAYLIRDQYDKIKECHGKLKRNISLSRFLKELGQYFYSNNKYLLARKCYSLILNEDSSDAYALTKMGESYLKTYVYDSALRYFKLSMKQNPDYAPGYLGLGKYYLERGDVQSAIGMLYKANKIDTLDNLVHWYLGACYLSCNDKSKATYHFLKNKELTLHNWYTSKIHPKDTIDNYITMKYSFALQNNDSVFKQYGITKLELRKFEKKLESMSEQY